MGWLKISVCLIVLIPFTSCIEGLELFKKEGEVLVIDGSITNEDGPHLVKVYFTTGFNKRSIYVDDAEVVIVDDLGNRELLTYYQYGTYRTSSTFTGTYGRAYWLEVALESGDLYVSPPDTLYEPPDINNVRFERGDALLAIFADFDDAAGEANYYRWRYLSTYEVWAPIASDPLAYCWTQDFDNELLNISSDQFYNGRTVEQHVANIAFDRSLEYGYYMDVKLQALSKKTYQYLNAIKTQQGNIGSIFDSAPYQIAGRMQNQNNIDELVLGYFQVSGVKKKAIFIDEYTGKFGAIDCTPNPQIPSRCKDCRLIGVNTTNVIPDFWPKDKNDSDNGDSGEDNSPSNAKGSK